MRKLAPLLLALLSVTVTPAVAQFQSGGGYVTPAPSSTWPVTVQNTNANGRATSANSSPVVLGTDGANAAPAGQTGTSAITVLAASGLSSNHEYMTGLQIGRSDSGTTAITAVVTDGTLTLTYVVPNNGGGGGNNITFPTPFQWALNHAVTCAASSAVTTFYCYAQGFNAP